MHEKTREKQGIHSENKNSTKSLKSGGRSGLLEQKQTFYLVTSLRGESVVGTVWIARVWALAHGLEG